MRIIRAVDPDGKLHALLAMAVQRSNYYPAVMRRARTVLIYKDGDVRQIGNWRPITVFPMSRRIVSKMFERRLRKIVSFSAPQMGFTSRPGCLLNITRLAGLLKRMRG